RARRFASRWSSRAGPGCRSRGARRSRGRARRAARPCNRSRAGKAWPARRPARADDVPEAADVALEPEALDERGDHGLAGELAGAVERDRQAPEVALAAGLGHVAVDRAARREHELLHAVDPGRFERVVGRDRALLEIEPRALEAPAGLGVRGE